MNAVRNLSDGLTEGDRRGAELAEVGRRLVAVPAAAEVVAPTVEMREVLGKFYAYDVDAERAGSADPV